MPLSNCSPHCYRLNMAMETMTSRLLQNYGTSSNCREDTSEHLLQRASTDHREGRLDEAEKGYLEVLRRKPDWGPVLNALGTVFLDQSRPDKARQAFEKAAELQPPYFPAHRSKILRICSAGAASGGSDVPKL